MTGLLSARRRSRLKCGSALNGAKNLGRSDRPAANQGLKFQSARIFDIPARPRSYARNAIFSSRISNDRFSPRLERHKGKRGRENVRAGGDQKHARPLPGGLLNVIGEGHQKSSRAFGCIKQSGIGGGELWTECIGAGGRKKRVDLTP